MTVPLTSTRPWRVPDRGAEMTQADVTSTVPSWEEIVEAHSGRIYRLSYRLTGNRADAEDLTQEVFVRVFRSLDTFTPGSIEGWLHRITTNLFLDQARRRAKIRIDALLDDPHSRVAERAVDAGGAPESQVLDTMLDDDVERALASLAPHFRVAVVLCDIEGLSYEEISAVLGLKLGTVRSRIHRGRAQLRKALAHRAPRAGRSRYRGALEAPRGSVDPAAPVSVPGQPGSAVRGLVGPGAR